MRTTKKIAGAAFGAAAMLALAAGPAFADGNVNANLKPNPGSGVTGSGTAMVQVTGATVTVTMAATGLLADQPHAAHIHFGADARHECPSLVTTPTRMGTSTPARARRLTEGSLSL